MAQALGERRLEIGEGEVLARIVRAGVEHELGLGRRVDRVEVESLHHIAVPRRAEMEDAAPECREPGIVALAQRAMGRLAGGQQRVVEAVGNPHRPHRPLCGGGAAGRVRQQDDALARPRKPGEAVDGAGQRRSHRHAARPRDR